MRLGKLTAACHSCTSTPMTLYARTFSGHVLSRLGRVSATGNRGSPDATNRTLRNEDSAQQGVSSLPLHARITACSLHSGGEGGSQKQVRESACQFYRIDAASVCTRAFMKSVMANKLHVFLASKSAPYVPTTANGVECPHISRVNVAGQKRCTFSPFGTKSTEVKSHFVHIAHL